MAVPALPVTNGVSYKVKLGKSFSDRNNNAFHTISYDFKPMSVDYSKPARMRVSEDEVIVSVPNVQAESEEHVTQFRGGKKICQKECVLIINTKTREATLERVTNTVQLKVLRPAKERSKVPAKMPDRSISPLPNPPTGHSLKLPNKLTNTSRSQSPSVGGRPPKKKKKTATVSGVTVKEDTIPVAVPVTQEPVALLPDTSSSSKSKSDASKPSTHPTAPVSSLSSSLSSSDSELEEVTGISMPTITPGNMVATAAAHGNNVGMAKRGRGYDGSSSSSGSDSGGSSSGSASDSDEEDDSNHIKHPSPRRPSMSVLHNDLRLSDSSSESESD
ncbi:ELL-associated factor 1-like [Dysidea avara]|uniref:ELL-associated factor 1-like n=1 Tax=Dysidea avara TaxID=196820 RepID=UPI003330AA20